MDEVDRFWERVEKTQTCWNWIGAKQTGGYGHFYLGTVNGKKVKRLAHRYSYELHNGPIPAGMDVLHKCDNPGCVNPEHLFLGTQATNDADRDAKGRQARGSEHGMAKLTEAQVREMRAAYAAGGVTYKELGQKYGVSGAQAHCAIAGVWWKHLR
jgi:hypothetical protein